MPAEDRVAQVTACGRFRDSDSFWQDASDSFPGSASMTRFVVVSVDRLTELRNTPWTTTNSANNGGWSFEWQNAQTASGPRWVVSASDGGGGGLFGTLTRDLKHVGSLELVSSGYDGSTLTVKAIGAAASTVAAGTAGFTASGRQHQIGVRVTNLDRPSFPVVACLGSDSESLSAAQLETTMQEIADNLAHGRAADTDLSVHTPEVYFAAEDIDFVAGTWTDRIGGLVLNQNGNPELFGVSARVL